MQHQSHLGKEMAQCIEHCEECHRICLETTTYCLQMGGKHAETDHIRLMMDCAQICQTSADFMLRGSPFHSRTCGICAEVCERCAGDCLQLAAGTDEKMQTCAEACNRCAQSCRKMSRTRIA